MGKRLAIFVSILLTAAACSCSKNAVPDTGRDEETGLQDRNLTRAMELVDNAVEHYFNPGDFAMSRYFNPYTGEKSSELGSVWMYTSSIEAVNAVLNALVAEKEFGSGKLYGEHFKRYEELLDKLISKLEYYRGTYILTSFTQTRQWSVYAVNRADAPGNADVTGVLNVYDDQMWLVKELLESYHLTGKKEYFEKAEYLAEYVLDGWDCTIKDGKERGGISWGPGYYSKHSCSNGPMVSPCVMLYEHYKGSKQTTTHRYIAGDGQTRVTETAEKETYYLNFAEKIYKWQKDNLLYEDSGVYADNLNGPVIGSDIQYEEVDGQTYRKPSDLKDFCGPAISYNSGTMLSGAADLYRATGNKEYYEDLRQLTDNSFRYFAKEDSAKPGLYIYANTGFNNWFNGVLMRGYADAYEFCHKAAEALDSFQNNLDYSWDNYLYSGMLPHSLTVGWNSDRSKNNVEGMFEFSFASEYAVLCSYLYNNSKLQ